MVGGLSPPGPTIRTDAGPSQRDVGDQRDICVGAFPRSGVSPLLTTVNCRSAAGTRLEGMLASAKCPCIEQHSASAGSSQHAHEEFAVPVLRWIESCATTERVTWNGHQSSHEFLDNETGCFNIEMKSNYSGAFFIIAQSCHSCVGTLLKMGNDADFEIRSRHIENNDEVSEVNFRVMPPKSSFLANILI